MIWVRRAYSQFNFLTREIVRRLLRKLIEIAITDLDLMVRFRDLNSSVVFEQKHLSKAAAFNGRAQLHCWLMQHCSMIDGLYLEFGVYKGDSINLLADLKPHVKWYGFDSFVGLPETWRLGSKAGAFSVGGRLPKVRSNVELVKGFFSETLPPFVERHKGEKVAFVNIDCDLYSSTKTVLDGLKNMLVPGSIILFDELFNYPGWQDEHEFLAFTEFVAQHNLSFEYLGYVRTACQVAVKIGQTPPQLAASYVPKLSEPADMPFALMNVRFRG